MLMAVSPASRVEQGKQLCIIAPEQLTGTWRLDGATSMNPPPGLGGSEHTRVFLDGWTEARGKLGFSRKLS